VQRFGYFVDLQGVTLDEAHKSWVHAMPIGEYSHPVYGKLKFTADRVKRFASSVVNKVRKIALDIDYDHKAHGGEAAGWVQDAQARDNGLWILVEWTQAAADKIRNREYRYFSPEFLDEWDDPQGAKHQDVLCGGGLTNRPFLKGDLLPVNLSELSFSDTTKEFKLDPKELRKQLGLPEDATDEQVSQQINSLKQSAGTTGNPTHPGTGDALPANTNLNPRDGGRDGVPSVDGSVEGGGNPFLSEELKKLSETNPTVKALLEAQASQARQLGEMQKALKLSEVTRKLSELNSDKQVVTPVAADLAREIVMLADDSVGSKVFELLKLVQENKATVSLGETGSSGSGSRSTDASPGKQLESAIQKKLSENKGLQYADAFTMVLSEQPELGKTYLAEMR
jgi:hypothetical protein